VNPKCESNLKREIRKYLIHLSPANRSQNIVPKDKEKQTTSV